MQDQIRISLPTDIDGFVTFQCPFCSELFKLDASEVQEDDVLEIFCPSCGLKNEVIAFVTDDVNEHIHQVTTNVMNNLVNDWTKDLEKMFKGKNGLTFKRGKPLPIEKPKVLYEKDVSMDVVHNKCCNRKIKVQVSKVQFNIYCPYCGVK